VLGLGYLSGKSFQRAPVLRIQRMPSSTRRLSAQGRPLLERLGSSGSMCDHCLSERNTSRIPSFSQQKKQKAPQKSKNLSETTYETASTRFSNNLKSQISNFKFHCLRRALGEKPEDWPWTFRPKQTAG
jgi:hypothetical protein